MTVKAERKKEEYTVCQQKIGRDAFDQRIQFDSWIRCDAMDIRKHYFLHLSTFAMR
jgi:hypothetical protein